MEVQNTQNSIPVSQPQVPLQPATSPQVQVPNQQDLKPVEAGEISLKTKIIYFCFGLIFNYVGLIPFLIWLVVKRKDINKTKVKSFVFGLLTAILLSVIFKLIVAPILQSKISEKLPETTLIADSLAFDYPDIKTEIFVEFVINSNESISILTVTLITDQVFSSEEIQQVGRKVCNLLDANSIYHDQIQVEIAKSKQFLLFSSNKSYGLGATCEEWQGDLPMQIPSQLKL